MSGGIVGRGLDLARLPEFEERLGHRFQDPDLLVAALTHASSRGSGEACNERLEFLGDAILGAIVSAHLFRTLPNCAEGRMTKIKSAVVSRKTLTRVGNGLDLAPWLIVGRMFASPGAITASILSNAVEAILAAIWLDGGYPAAEGFVMRELATIIERAANEPGGRDHKSVLGQWAQAKSAAHPHYELVSTAGPDHTKTFEIRVTMADESFPPGWGRSKKEAEQNAARIALHVLGEERAG